MVDLTEISLSCISKDLNVLEKVKCSSEIAVHRYAVITLYTSH